MPSLNTVSKSIIITTVHYIEIKSVKPNARRTGTAAIAVVRVDMQNALSNDERPGSHTNADR